MWHLGTGFSFFAGLGNAGLMDSIGFYDLRELFQPKGFYDL